MNVKLNQKNAISTATLGVSAASGVMASKGAMSYAPASLKKPLVRLGIGAIGFVLASAITGTGTLVEVAKGVSIGVGIQQTSSAIAGFVSPSIAKLEEGSKVKQFLSASVDGLAGVEENANFQIPANLWDNSQEQEEMKLTTGGFASV